MVYKLINGTKTCNKWHGIQDLHIKSEIGILHLYVPVYDGVLKNLSD